jgi:hypothetical protein
MIKKEQAVKSKPKPVAPKPQVSQQKAAPAGSCCGTKPGVKATKA